PVHQVRQSARASTSCVGDGHVGSQHLNAFVHHTLQHLLGLPLQALKRHLGTNEKRFYPLHHLVQTLRVSPAEHLHHGRQPSPAPTPSPVFDPVGKGVLNGPLTDLDTVA